MSLRVPLPPPTPVRCRHAMRWVCCRRAMLWVCWGWAHVLKLAGYVLRCPHVGRTMLILSCAEPLQRFFHPLFLRYLGSELRYRRIP